MEDVKLTEELLLKIGTDEEDIGTLRRNGLIGIPLSIFRSQKWFKTRMFKNLGEIKEIMHQKCGYGDEEGYTAIYEYPSGYGQVCGYDEHGNHISTRDDEHQDLVRYTHNDKGCQ